MSEHITQSNANGGLTRPRYFPRQLVTAADLNDDQAYMRERLRRHNRLLHGCGVVCGLIVRLEGGEAQTLAVGAGTALDGIGNEIDVPADVSLPPENLPLLMETPDGRVRAVWPPPSFDPCPEGDPGEACFYLAVCYRETASHPRPNLRGDHCTGEVTCEPSRLHDDYEFVLLDSILPSDCVERNDNLDEPAWLGEYYQYPEQEQPPEAFPDGPPALVRNDPVINFNWGGGAPDPRLEPDYLIVRWTRKLYFPAGKYLFRTVANNGVRLFIDDNLCIDDWNIGTTRINTCEFILPPGVRQIRLEYFERTELAIAQLHWAPLETGWYAQYYQYPEQPEPPDFPTAPPNLVRVDPGIGFDWRGGSPAAEIKSNFFMVRWTRDLDICAPGEYEFSTFTDDGVRLFIGDALIIDNWRAQPPQPRHARIMLGPGRHRAVMEFYERTGGAVAKLTWRRIGAYNPPCTPAPEKSCVVLAKLQASGAGFTGLDNIWFDVHAGYRRQVLASAEALCSGMDCEVAGSQAPVISQIAPGAGVRGTRVSAVIFGQNLGGATLISFPASEGGVSGRILPGGTGSWVPVSLTISDEAPVAQHPFIISTPNCMAQSADFGVAFEVIVATPATTTPPVVTTLPPIFSTLPPIATTLPPIFSTLPPIVTTLPPIFSTLPPIVGFPGQVGRTTTIFDPADFPGRSVNEVNGIGEVFSGRLAENNVTNLAELASMEAGALAEVLKVSEVRAMGFIDQAGSLLGAGK